MSKRTAKLALTMIALGFVLMFASVGPAHAQAGVGTEAAPAGGGGFLTTDGARKLGGAIGAGLADHRRRRRHRPHRRQRGRVDRPAARGGRPDQQRHDHHRRHDRGRHPVRRRRRPPGGPLIAAVATARPFPIQGRGFEREYLHEL